MPIRRAAAVPTKEKAPSAAAEKEPEASPEDLPSAGEEQAAPSGAAGEVEEIHAEEAEVEEAHTGEEDKAAGEPEPTENGEKAEEPAEEKPEEGTEKKEQSDKCKDCAAGQCATHCYVFLLRLKDGYKYEKAKVKKMKKTIPAWASITASKKVPVTNFSGTQNKVDNILIEAIMSSDGGVSYQSFMKYILKKYPGMELDRKKFLLKKALKKHLEKGTIKQLKGKGLSGTFAIGKQSNLLKKATQKNESLGDALPLIITRLCEPKEASYYLIKKYLEQHFPSLNIERRPEVLKTALVKAVEKGQLEQITGKGARGTFQLKRTGTQVLLKGGALEDAITAAITAMNEPKTCSTTTLRKYLLDSNKDTKEHHLVANLRRTLNKCKVLGWMEQITGHGFTGTYQLSFPFYPSPSILYPDKFKKLPEKAPASSNKQRRMAASSDDDDEEEESEEESEDEAPTRKRSRKRPPPKAQRPSPAKKSRGASQSRAQSRGRSPAKKSVAKKVPSKRSLKEESKASPVKRAPVKKPKTPAVKKLTKRGSKRQASRGSSPPEAVATKVTPRSTTKRAKAEESPEEEPAIKEPNTKSGSRGAKPKESSPAPPAVKQGGRGARQSIRKSKRGKY